MSSIKDNHKRGSVGGFLRDTIKPESALSFVSAYFTIYAYKHLKTELDGISHLRFLFGEPAFIKSLDPEHGGRRDFTIADNEISLRKRLEQKTTAKECAAWIQGKVFIKSMVKPNFLHGKLYHIINANGTNDALMGSSNFTVKGLGLNQSPNIELNLITNDRRDLADLKGWFDELWNDDTGLVADVKDEVLDYLQKLYAENSPEFIYFKTLFHVFEKYLDEQHRGGLLDERTGFFDSEIWQMLYDFQKDGVKGAINKILNHNGCIIADSVGLGKTFEALAVIQYFERLNKDVLVLCPKKLAANWTIYQSRKNNALNPFTRDRFNYNVLYHTDMGRISGKGEADGVDFENFQWGNYGLVVIDESHNFRGNPLEKVKDDGAIRMNRAKWLMDRIIKSGVKTKVLLLSATPVNNSLRDLRNQILLITEGQPDALFERTQIRNISSTLEVAQKQFTIWADKDKNPKRNVKDLLERLDSSFFKLLDELTIARSRKHIKSSYDVAAIGNFPERLKPISVYPEIDLQQRFLTYDYLNQQIAEYKLSIFNPSFYVRVSQRQKYKEIGADKEFGFTQSNREHYLIGMMKVNFLKRLESSIESFEISLNRTIEKIEQLIKKIKRFQNQGAGSEPFSLFEMEPSEDELEENAEDAEQWQVGRKLRYDLADLRLNDWLRDLEKDKTALVLLYNHAYAIGPERDAKLKTLKERISDKLRQPLNEGNRKVVVFTAYADTATYLYDNLKTWAQKELKLNIALVAGNLTRTTFGKNEFGNILTNFSPRSKQRNLRPTLPQAGEIDLLIATDCISEGQNLQDCDYLINYDIHWNPVRIIQRFGRIDRLGSTNGRIQLVNFWPTRDLDNYINLKERVEARMALVDVTATGDENLLNVEQIEDLIEEDLNFRNQQLKRLKEEVLDLEEMNESISLTDFTLDDFRLDLLNFLETNRRELADAPLGLYAVVPAPGGAFAAHWAGREFTAAEREIIQPGALFCLRQKESTASNEAINPLQPFFLVYIRDDGTVRFNYTSAKQILEIFQLLCQGRREAFAAVCDALNAETQDGAEMGRFSELLRQAVAAISQTFKRRGQRALTFDRSALLTPRSKQINDADDFELITWLIIK